MILRDMLLIRMKQKLETVDEQFTSLWRQLDPVIDSSVRFAAENGEFSTEIYIGSNFRAESVRYVVAMLRLIGYSAEYDAYTGNLRIEW